MIREAAWRIGANRRVIRGGSEGLHEFTENSQLALVLWPSHEIVRERMIFPRIPIVESKPKVVVVKISENEERWVKRT